MRRACVVAFRGADVLLMRRRKQGRDYVTTVGGRLEPGESVVEAALRELTEETGLVGEAALRDYAHTCLTA